MPPSAATAAAVTSAGLAPLATASSGRPPLVEGEARRELAGGSAACCEPHPAAASDVPAAARPASLRNSLRVQSRMVPQG